MVVVLAVTVWQMCFNLQFFFIPGQDRETLIAQVGSNSTNWQTYSWLLPELVPRLRTISEAPTNKTTPNPQSCVVEWMWPHLLLSNVHAVQPKLASARAGCGPLLGRDRS